MAATLICRLAGQMRWIQSPGFATHCLSRNAPQWAFWPAMKVWRAWRPAYRLPTAISGMNSNWFRGYGDPPPQTVIVVGMHRNSLDQTVNSCELVGLLTLTLKGNKAALLFVLFHKR